MAMPLLQPFWPLGTGSAEGILRGLWAAWSRGRRKKTERGAGRGRRNGKVQPGLRGRNLQITCGLISWGPLQLVTL